MYAGKSMGVLKLNEALLVGVVLSGIGAAGWLSPREDWRRDELSLLELKLAVENAGRPVLGQGRIAHQEGDLRRAVSLLRQAVRLDDQDIDARFELAEALQQRGAAGGDGVDLLEAIDIWNGILRIAPENQRAIEGRKNGMRQLGIREAPRKGQTTEAQIDELARKVAGPEGAMLGRLRKARLSFELAGYRELQQDIDVLQSRRLDAPGEAWRDFELAYWSVRLARNQCEEWTRRAVKSAERVRWQFGVTMGLTERAYCEYARGKIQTAQDSLREAMRLSREAKLAAVEVRAGAFLSSYLAVEGRYGEAGELMLAVMRLADKADLAERNWFNLRGLAIRLCELLGYREAQAWISYQQAEAARREGIQNVELLERGFTSRLWAELGDKAAAKREANRLRQLVDRYPAGTLSPEVATRHEASWAFAIGDREAMRKLIGNPVLEVGWRVTLASKLAALYWQGEDRARAREVCWWVVGLVEGTAKGVEARRVRAPLRAAYELLRNERVKDGDAAGAWRVWDRGRKADARLAGFGDSVMSNANVLEVGIWRVDERVYLAWRHGGKAGLKVVPGWERGWKRDAARLRQLYLSADEGASRELAAEMGKAMFEGIDLAPGMMSWEADAGLDDIAPGLLRVGGAYVGDRMVVARRVSGARGWRESLPLERGVVVAPNVVERKWRREFAWLPELEQEANTVAKKMPIGVTLVDKKANRIEVEKQEGNWDVLHFAGHADAERGWLVVSESGDRNEFWRDFGNLRNRYGVVVVAGCEGAGANERLDSRLDQVGEGFLKLGAGMVVATQWPLDHAGAMEWSRIFYDSWRASGDVVRSVGDTAREMRARGWRPMQWAAMQVLF